MPVRIIALAIILSLSACAGGSSTSEPQSMLIEARSVKQLATDAEIDAATKAPLNEWAASGRWNEPYAPFTVLGNIHYVGSETVSAFLITSPAGHILIDGILAQTGPQIAANIKALGYDIKDVKYLLNSHAHFDHAAGLAYLQRASGAQMFASAADKPILDAGQIDFGPSAGIRFPKIAVDRLVGDGDTVKLGPLTLTAHMTPGHSPGCTSWSTQVQDAAGHNHPVFFHCSPTVAGQSLVPEAYPGMVADYRATFRKVSAMRADVFLANHDSFFDLHEKRKKQLAGDEHAFVDAEELQQFNTVMESAFEAELARQKAAKAP